MSSPVIGNALISVRATLDKLDADLAKASSTTDSWAQQTGKSMQRTGLTLTKTLTPAAGAIGLLAKQAFGEWDAGLDAIRAGTGATGDELDKLGESMKRVGGQVTQPLSEVGAMMAQVASRTGLTGPPLEKLTKQLLDLNGRLNQTVSAEDITRFFGDWSISTDKQSKALDTLFRASQRTGTSVATIAQLMVAFGAPLRELGFTWQESAVLMGKFNKEGVNTEGVLAGLKISVAKFAAEGKTPAQGLQDVIAKMKELGPGAEATSLAMETFGKRAGIDVAKAIEEGRFELGKLLDQVTNGRETVQQAADDTKDWGDTFAMLKNKLFATIGPLGEYGMALGGIAAGLGPAVLLGGKFLKVLGQLPALLSNIYSAGLQAASAISAMTLAQAGLLLGTAGIVALTVGLGAAIIGMSLLGDAHEDARRKGEAWAASIAKSATTAGGYAEQLDFLRARQTNVGYQLDSLRAKQSALEATSTADTTATKNLGDQMSATADKVAHAEGKHDGLAKAIKRLKQEQQDAVIAEEARVKSLRDMQNGTKDVTVATDEERAALEKLQGQINIAAGGELGYQSALKARDDAYADLLVAIHDHGIASDEARDADLRLRQAQLQLANSADELDKANQDLVISIANGTLNYDAQIARLREQIRLHPEAAAGYQLEIDKLDAAKAAADRLPPEKTIQLRVDALQADLAIEHTRDLLGSMGIVWDGTVQPPPPTAARGMIVPARRGGTLIRVGEAGHPEVIVPTDDMARAESLLKQAGILEQFVPSTAPVADYAGGSSRMSHEGHAGGQSVTHRNFRSVQYITAPRPEEAAAAAVRRQRSEAWLRGW